MSEGGGAVDGALRWRCRRGMRELDLLLARFVDEEHARASSDQRRAFDRLIALPDPELAAYLLGHERPADPELAAIADTVARRH